MTGNNKKIAIIGHFGGNEDIFDGQTIKTKILYDELSKATNWKIRKVDTYYKSHNPVKLLIQSLLALLATKDVIVMLSGHGMKFYFPLLSFFSRVFGTRVYHDVIGGNLDSYVKNNPKFKKYLNSFKVNWVETENLRKKLETLEITNCEVIPNFKRLNIAEIDKADYKESFKFCMFSRVMKEKGVEDAINAIEEINSDAGRRLCQLDIYGRVDDVYKETFEALMNDAPPYIQYKGQVPYEKSVEAIKEYYALLFPTYWHGEGFPGTIVDAFSAGLPVIATDWSCNGEIIENEVNGILYPSDQFPDLLSCISWAISNPIDVQRMSQNCLVDARKYTPDKYIKKIIRDISANSKK